LIHHRVWILGTFDVDMRLRLFLLFFLIVQHCSAQQQLRLTKLLPMYARLMTADELGNVYVVRDNNSLVRFSENGDSSAFFRSVQNGDIGSVDATNPMHVVVYYPAYSRVTILDRQLAPKNELDLRRLNIANTSVVAASADGNLWVYDQFNARLKKIDQQLQQLVESNDVRIESGTVPVPSFILERDWKVFLCDTLKGIYTFDRYGNYINTLSIYGVTQLQVFGSQLIYRRSDSLMNWDMNRVVSKALKIPDEGRVISAVMVRNNVYVLYHDKLAFYRLDDE